MAVVRKLLFVWMFYVLLLAPHFLYRATLGRILSFKDKQYWCTHHRKMAPVSVFSFFSTLKYEINAIFKPVLHSKAFFLSGMLLYLTPLWTLTISPHLEGLFRGIWAGCQVRPGTLSFLHYGCLSLWQLELNVKRHLDYIWIAQLNLSHLSIADGIFNTGKGIYVSSAKQPKRDA